MDDSTLIMFHEVVSWVCIFETNVGHVSFVKCCSF
jgi:hypothetical protein